MATKHTSRMMRPWIIATVALFVIDRILKNLVLSGVSFSPGEWFSFALYRNALAAFGTPIAMSVYLPFAVLLFMLFGLAYRAAEREGSPSAPYLLLIVTGAFSNLLDRILYGAVIDHLIFFGRSAVNIADAMIVCGVLLLLVRSRK